MPLAGLACVVAAATVAGCSGSTLPPEAVVRAWSDAVNTGDDARAASQLARGAIVIANGRTLTLKTAADAEAWSRSLRCAGIVRSLATHKDIVTVTFLLSDRGTITCPGAGGTATDEFEVRSRRIVFFRQLSSTPPGAPLPPASTTGSITTG